MLQMFLFTSILPIKNERVIYACFGTIAKINKAVVDWYNKNISIDFSYDRNKYILKILLNSYNL